MKKILLFLFSLVIIPSFAFAYVDTTAPKMLRAGVDRDSVHSFIVLSFDDILSGPTSNPDPSPSDFTVMVNGKVQPVSSAHVNSASGREGAYVFANGGTFNEVLLTMSSALPTSGTITVSYAPGVNKIKDIWGNVVSGFSNVPVVDGLSTDTFCPNLIPIFTITGSNYLNEQNHPDSGKSMTLFFDERIKGGIGNYIGKITIDGVDTNYNHAYAFSGGSNLLISMNSGMVVKPNSNIELQWRFSNVKDLKGNDWYYNEKCNPAPTNGGVITLNYRPLSTYEALWTPPVVSQTVTVPATSPVSSTTSTNTTAPSTSSVTAPTATTNTTNSYVYDFLTATNTPVPYTAPVATSTTTNTNTTTNTSVTTPTNTQTLTKPTSSAVTSTTTNPGTSSTTTTSTSSQIVTNTNTTGASIVVCRTTTFVSYLKQGMYNKEVKALQIFLSKFGYMNTATGYYGPLTATAVSSFQTNNNILPAVGYVGPLTRAALNAYPICS